VYYNRYSLEGEEFAVGSDVIVKAAGHDFFVARIHSIRVPLAFGLDLEPGEIEVEVSWQPTPLDFSSSPDPSIYPIACRMVSLPVTDEPLAPRISNAAFFSMPPLYLHPSNFPRCSLHQLQWYYKLSDLSPALQKSIGSTAAHNEASD
jgi:hypothetical protein